MSDEKRCDRCGGVIPGGTATGECPGCLLEAGLGAGPNEGATLDRAELATLFPALEIGEFIGRGGMGLVYKATQRNLGRTVALKILSSDVAGQEAFAERFNREARALAKLSHPNIVGVHESGRAGDYYYFIMEYVDGVNLRQAMQTGGLLAREALAIVPQICDALQYAHDQGVVHRDVKPENILLDQQGRVKIADFGLAKLLGGGPSNYTLTREREGMGTLHYIAPEQMRSARDVDHRADIYSLGVVFYEMLTGDLPMGNFPPPSRKVKVDVHLDQVVLRAMEQERERRYQRVDEFKSGIQCPPAAAAPTDGRPTAISKLAVTGILGAPVALLAVAIAWAAGLQENAPLGAIFAGIALIGIAFSAMGWRAIKADPTRLTGLTTARMGALYPVLVLGPALAVLGTMAMIQGSVIAAAAGVLGVILFIVAIRAVLGHDSRASRHPEVRRPRSVSWVLGVIVLILFLGGGIMMIALLLMPGEPMHDLGDGRYVSGAKWVTVLRDEDVMRLLSEVTAFAGAETAWVGDAHRLLHPEARRRVEKMTPAELATAAENDEMGLLSLDLASMPAPLIAFTIERKRVSRFTARVLIRHGATRIEFPLAILDRRWYLGLGKLTHIEQEPGDGNE